MLPDDVPPQLAALQGQYFARIRSTPATLAGPATRGVDLVAQMVSTRLHEALRHQFPCLASALGAEAFECVAVAYLAVYPSKSASLRHVGARFATFLKSQTGIPLRPDMPELAHLEWARVEVFDAADEPPLERQALATWAEKQSSLPSLRAVRAFRLVRTRFAVEDCWLAADGGHSLPQCAASPGALFVWRRECAVYHRRASEPEVIACERLLRGGSLDDVCADLAVEATPEDAAVTAFRILDQWMADGFVTTSVGDG